MKRLAMIIVSVLILFLNIKTMAASSEEYVYLYDKYSVITSRKYVAKQTYVATYSWTTFQDYYPDLFIDQNTGEINISGNTYRFVINGGKQQGYMKYGDHIELHITEGEQGSGSTSIRTRRYIIESQIKITESKGDFIKAIISDSKNYPDDGKHVDGYWYVYKGMQKLNRNPQLIITEPIFNYRTGDQDTILITGKVLDEDLGDILKIKYDLDTFKNNVVTLTQPTSLISNGQMQAFQGYIKLNGLNSGSNILKIWAEDNESGKSNVIGVPIIVFNTLENILNSLKSYVHTEKPQIIVVNSNNTIIQTQKNNELIEEIKKELEEKNILIFFIGKDGQTESYIRSKLFSN